MRTEEEGACPPRLYRWLHQVTLALTLLCTLQVAVCVGVNYERFIVFLISRSPSVTVFTESLPSDSGDNMASQSVPMVTASAGMASAGDDGDEVFMEHEGEG